MVTMRCSKCQFTYQVVAKPEPEESMCPCGESTMEIIEEPTPTPTPISRICRLCVNRGSLCTECPIIKLNNDPNVHFCDITE